MRTSRFMFQLDSKEAADLRCQSGTSSSWGGRRYLPYAFTEQGATQPGQAIPRYDRGMNSRTPLPPVYDRDAVAPLWQELAAVGVEPLTTPEEVDALLRSGSGTALVIVNSVCGCAAGQARPGAMLALQNGVIPDRSVTVFAGVDRDAVEQARGYMTGYPPSSPSMGLFKDGKLVSMLQRTDLQQMNEEQVSQALCSAFDEHCSRTGPSIAPEEFQKIRPYRGCGSKIPLASAPQ
jgi:putative YphP/YqiW family bacilliredoxin